MLTESQITEVWESQIAAETRALYFGDLASVYSLRKQWITGISFFLASGAAATLIAKIADWVPITCSIIVAVITAYSVAVNLDAKIRTMSKLHYSWAVIGNDYRRLWNQTYSDEAVSELDELQRRELELSELATTEAPNDIKRLSRWQDQVFKLHRLENA
jgi:predicted oxidoreductase (fatty acid repression mutant protein)